MTEPLLTITQLFQKWEKVRAETGYAPVPVSRETLYRLVRERKVRCHGQGTALVRESEVIEDFLNSRPRKFGVIDGNPHLGRKKEKVAAELDRLCKRPPQTP